MSQEQPCKLCNGKKHIEQDGIWIPCDCLEFEQWVRYLRAAGVTEEYIPITLDQVVADTPLKKQTKNLLKAACQRLHKRDLKDVIVVGKFADVKLAGTILFKASSLTSGSATIIQLDDLTNAFLTQDKRIFNGVRKCESLCIFFGEEYTQRIHQYILNHLVSVRGEPMYRTVWATTCQKQGFQDLYKPTDAEFWFTQVEWISIASGFNS